MIDYVIKTIGYRIWLSEEHKIIETINVTFNKPDAMEKIKI